MGFRNFKRGREGGWIVELLHCEWSMGNGKIFEVAIIAYCLFTIAYASIAPSHRYLNITVPNCFVNSISIFFKC